MPPLIVTVSILPIVILMAPVATIFISVSILPVLVISIPVAALLIPISVPILPVLVIVAASVLPVLVSVPRFVILAVSVAALLISVPIPTIALAITTETSEQIINTHNGLLDTLLYELTLVVFHRGLGYKSSSRYKYGERKNSVAVANWFSL